MTHGMQTPVARPLSNRPGQKRWFALGALRDINVASQ